MVAKGSGGNGGGEVVQVHGGHIIRSTAGKKDRHSKVYTAKGPRDRRVRLAAHTAIQFYDVQDRLGYDRPSKAVDWLMEKAKDAIDKLERLLPFDPRDFSYNGPGLTEAVPDQALVETGLEESVGFVGSGHPHRDLCLSLQSFGNGAGFGQVESVFPTGWSSETSTPAEMGRFSRLLAWTGGGGEGGALQSSFHPQPSIRAWDELQVGQGTGAHLEQHRFMEFYIPRETGGASEDAHAMIAAHHHHHHHGASNSMSTTTDSSH